MGIANTVGSRDEFRVNAVMKADAIEILARLDVVHDAILGARTAGRKDRRTEH